MRASADAAFLPFTEPLEGVVRFMYLDVKGLVTVAIGNLVDPIGAALALPLRRADGELASADEIRADWERVKARQDLALHGGMAYASVAQLRLDEDGVRQVVQGRLDLNEATLRQRFPQWDEWPADAQLATMSMAWACGAAFHYPRMAALLNAGDFDGASEECTINPNMGTIVERNRRNVALYRAAAVTQTPDEITPGIF